MLFQPQVTHRRDHTKIKETLSLMMMMIFSEITQENGPQDALEIQNLSSV